MLSKSLFSSTALFAALLATSPASAHGNFGGTVQVSAGVRVVAPQIRVQVGVPAPPVIYAQPVSQPIYIQTQPAPVYYYQPPPPPPPRTYYVSPGYSVELGEQPAKVAPEWGISGRLSGGGFGGSDRYGRSGGVGGIGLGLRYRPIPYFAVEGNIDGYAGVDGLGRSRGETAFSVNALAFFNPKSRLQFYGLAGLGVGHSFVGDWCETYYSSGPGYGTATFCAERGEYNYIGGQLGAGLEFRASRSLAFNADLRGFLRTSGGRVGDGQPEFVAADGRATNTSGGALLTLGATIYFR